MAKVATVTARKPAPELRAKPTGEIVTLPKRDHNKPDLLAETAIMSNVHTAFDTYDKSVKDEGSATQRLAYAVMAKQKRLVYDGASVPELSRVAFDRKVTGELLLHIREWAIGDRPAKPDDDASATRMDTYLRHSALLNRAIEFASVLAKCNAQMTQFNDKTGLWSVPVIALFPPKHTPLGDNPERLVQLDNRGYGATTPNDKGAPKFVKSNASVRAMVAAVKPAPVQTGNATNAGQGKPDTDAAADAMTALPAGKIAVAFAGKMLPLLDALHILFVTDAGADAKLTDYSEKERNLLTDIVRQYDVLKARDAK
jgi:hypothetical protein